MNKPSRTSGVTIIELMVVVVILCILGALIALTASGVQANNRNKDRQAEIDTLRTQLEARYAETDTYPTLDNLNDKEWRSEHMPKLAGNVLSDPRWDKGVEECTKDEKPIVTSEPAPNCYSYQVTSSDGADCDNDEKPCVHYTLTATFEGGEKYVKSSLN